MITIDYYYYHHHHHHRDDNSMPNHHDSLKPLAFLLSLLSVLSISRLVTSFALQRQTVRLVSVTSTTSTVLLSTSPFTTTTTINTDIARTRTIMASSTTAAEVASSSLSSSSHKDEKALVSSSSSSRRKRTIHWGIAGLGDVTQKKSGPPFWKCHGSQLVAVMRRTPGKAAEFAQRVPTNGSSNSSNAQGCVGYDSLQACLDHPQSLQQQQQQQQQQETQQQQQQQHPLDAIYIATRPGSHLEVCQQVAAAGKAVYIEKPVGRCAAETQAIQDVCHAAGVPLYTAYISRGYDRTQAVKRLLYDDRVIGDTLESIKYQLVGTGGARDMEGGGGDAVLPWRLDAAQSGGGLVMDVGCHVLDRLAYWCQAPLQNVQGTAENRNSPHSPVEDYVHLKATIGESYSTMHEEENRFQTQGATVECTWDFAAVPPHQRPKDELILQGSKGSIRMAGMSPDGPIEVLDASGQLVLQTLTFGTPEHTAQYLIQAVTDDLLGIRSEEYLSRGDNALRTSEALDTVLEGYYGGREIGYWNRAESWPGRIQKQQQQQHKEMKDGISKAY